MTGRASADSASNINAAAIKSVLFFTVPLLVARLYGLVANFDSPFQIDMALPISRGLASDLVAGIVVGAIARVVWRVRPLFATLWVLWLVVHFLNIEHVSVNRSNLDYGFAGLALTDEFIGGSVLSWRALVPIVVCTSLSALILAACSFFEKRPQARRIDRRFWVALVVAAGILLVPPKQLLPNWIQMNLIEENLRSLMFTPSRLQQEHLVDEKVFEEFFGRDLSGEAILPIPAEPTNVLIIMVEGIGYDVSNTDLMPTFKSLHAEYLSYTNFLSLQRQTNRGIYSVLCGDYPNFVTKEAKSDLMGVFGPRSKCLAERLRERGYRTVFMQGSPLGYMRKDKFAEQAGFEEIIGSNAYGEAYARNNWGVDDRTFYQNARTKLIQLERAREPWFLSLLSVTTHHPYLVPGKSAPSEEEAVRYADLALGEFLEGLQRDGVLKNTLILLTSDESTFAQLAEDRREPVFDQLAENHAPLIIWGPGVPRSSIVGGLFGQVDIAVSVLDYLGISSDGLLGRSIFRSYDDDRSVIFGNAFTSKIFALTANGSLYACSKALDCSAYRTNREAFFGGSLQSETVNEQYLDEMRQALSSNELDSAKIDAKYVFLERNKKYHGTRWLLGDHKLQADKGDRITWTIRISAEDPVRVVARALLVESEEVYEDLFDRIAHLKGQDEFQFSHQFSPEYDAAWIWTKIYVLADKQSRYEVLELAVERSNR